MNFTITKHTVRRGLAAVSASLDSRANNVPSAMLLIVAIIYLLPLSGVFGGETVALLYGPNYNRGIVFIVGLLIFGAFTPSWRPATYVGVFGTGVTTLYISGSDTLAANASVAGVLALICLGIGGIALVVAPRRA